MTGLGSQKKEEWTRRLCKVRQNAGPKNRFITFFIDTFLLYNVSKATFAIVSVWQPKCPPDEFRKAFEHVACFLTRG